jgi:hypothetical protein
VLAQIGVVILDLELRTYDPDGSITDVHWSTSKAAGFGNPVRDAQEAVGALDRPALPGDWMLVTMSRSRRPCCSSGIHDYVGIGSRCSG